MRRATLAKLQAELGKSADVMLYALDGHDARAHFEHTRTQRKAAL